MDILSGRALVGKTLRDRYRLDAFIGKGGMSWVFQGFDLQTQISVAVKILLPHLVEEPRVRARFEDEGRYQSRLHHTNIVQVYDVFSEGTVCAIIMEWIVGEDLRDLLKRLRQSIPLTEIWHLMSAILDAMSHAHACSLIHRDLKPSNILLHQDNTRMIPKVADFGIAKAIDEQDDGLTRTGASLGTLKYMAPEQFLDSKHVDQRADIYSLGVLLFLLLTGRLPFRGDSQVVLYKQMHEGPPSPRTLNPEISEYLEQILLRCLSTSPEQRYASCDELSHALCLAMLCEFGVSIEEHEHLTLPALREIVREYLFDLGDATAVGDMQGFAVGTMLYQSFMERPLEKESPDGLLVRGGSGGGLSSLHDSSHDSSRSSQSSGRLDVPNVAFHQANASLKQLPSIPRISGPVVSEQSEFPLEDLEHHEPLLPQATQSAMAAFVDPQALLDSSFQNQNYADPAQKTVAQGFFSPFADAATSSTSVPPSTSMSEQAWPTSPSTPRENEQGAPPSIAFASTLASVDAIPSAPPHVTSSDESWVAATQAPILSAPSVKAGPLLGDAWGAEETLKALEHEPLFSPKAASLAEEFERTDEAASLLFRKPERRPLFSSSSPDAVHAGADAPSSKHALPSFSPTPPQRVEVIPQVLGDMDGLHSSPSRSLRVRPPRESKPPKPKPSGPHILWWMGVGFFVISALFAAFLWVMSGEREASIDEPPLAVVEPIKRDALPKGDGYWDERERPVWVWNGKAGRPQMHWKKMRVWIHGKKPEVRETLSPKKRKSRHRRRRKRR